MGKDLARATESGCGINCIYFDNAATSWPKPPQVAEAMTRFLNDIGGSPGRSGHRLSIEAGRIVYAAREAVAELFGAPDPLRVTFSHNVTQALNQALRGLLRPGDHVITSSVEHNSMMRPLRALQDEGIELTVVQCSPEGSLDPADIEGALQPNTVMIALNHASNVVGTILPIAEVGRVARERELILLVDAAQTAGALPLDMRSEQIDLLGFTGHKSLYGPMGTGGLIFGSRVKVDRLRPLIHGGTGSQSEHEKQPAFLPDMCESGTPNAVGLAGLAAGIRWVQEFGVETIRKRELELTRRLVDGLSALPDVTVYGTRNPKEQIATVSFTVEGREPSEVALMLDEEYAILCRVGLHCSPAAHRTIGTFPAGTVRFGLGAFSTDAEVDAAVAAVEQLARGRRG